MLKIWNSLSQFGTSGFNTNRDIRSIVLCNQINILTILVSAVILIVLRLHGYLYGNSPGIASLKIILMITGSMINLFLSKFNFIKTCKFLTSVLPSFFFLYFPFFFSYFEEDSFINYPMAAIAASVIPLLIFSLEKETVIYFIALFYSFGTVFIIDILLIILCPDTIYLKSVIINIYPFYKISSVLAFLFINVSIIYLKRLNISSENYLKLNNLELQSALEELNKAQNMLIQNEKMASVGILSAGVAHEINNPVNFIYSGIQCLSENYKYLSQFIEETLKLSDQHFDQNTKEKLNLLKSKFYYNDIIVSTPNLIESIIIGSERTNQIVKALQYFENSGPEVLELIDLNETIDIACKIYKPKIENRVVIKQFFNENLPQLKCYSGLIKQLIINLLSNSIDSITEKGEIFITTNRENNVVLNNQISASEIISISIKDNGCGIDKENLDKIFLPFFTTKEVGKGTGMGLAICHNIVEKHMGKIEVKSIKNQGSEFIVYLPCNP